MNILILGGESPRHYEWVRKVAEALQPHFERVVYLDYRHWASGGSSDIEYEITQAGLVAKDLNDYVIVAKSMGTVVASLAAAQGKLAPKGCVFMGLPLGLVERTPGAAEALHSLPPTIFIQNQHDPVGSAKDVEAFVGAHGNSHASMFQTAGDTHDYTDFVLITKFALQAK